MIKLHSIRDVPETGKPSIDWIAFWRWRRKLKPRSAAVPIMNAQNGIDRARRCDITNDQRKQLDLAHAILSAALVEEFLP